VRVNLQNLPELAGRLGATIDGHFVSCGAARPSSSAGTSAIASPALRA
jgi:hypothetical protein